MGVNLSKQSEITITPVVPGAQSVQQSLMQQQLQLQQEARLKSELFMNMVSGIFIKMIKNKYNFFYTNYSNKIRKNIFFYNKCTHVLRTL